jgi:hypothetical protein
MSHSTAVKLRLTVILVSTSGFGLWSVYEASLPLLLVKNNAMNFAAALLLRIDPEKFK